MRCAAAVAFLAHFCDNHGPRAVVCTRVAVDGGRLPGGADETVRRCGPSSKQKFCAACHSLDADVRCFSSEDPVAGLTFLSCNAFACNPELERRLKTAASRSLSVEEPAAEGKEVFFSDEGVAFSKCFRYDGSSLLRTLLARTIQRNSRIFQNRGPGPQGRQEDLLRRSPRRRPTPTVDEVEVLG